MIVAYYIIASSRNPDLREHPCVYPPGTLWGGTGNPSPCCANRVVVTRLAFSGGLMLWGACLYVKEGGARFPSSSVASTDTMYRPQSCFVAGDILGHNLEVGAIMLGQIQMSSKCRNLHWGRRSNLYNKIEPIQ